MVTRSELAKALIELLRLFPLSDLSFIQYIKSLHMFIVNSLGDVKVAEDH